MSYRDLLIEYIRESEIVNRINFDRKNTNKSIQQILLDIWRDNPPPIPIVLPTVTQNPVKEGKDCYLELLADEVGIMSSYRPRGNVLPLTFPLQQINNPRLNVSGYAASQDVFTRLISTQKYQDLDNLVDNYTLVERMRAYRTDLPVSYADGWTNLDFMRPLIEQALTASSNGNILNLLSLISVKYTEKIHLANNFGISRAIGLVRVAEELLGKSAEVMKWLDISAGWGDRLLAACLLGMEYQGYDPNTALEGAYTKMITDYGTLVEDRYLQEVKILPFEQSNPQENYYDLVLTSPPFYNIEVYSEDAQQSITQYPRLNTWITDFLFQSLHKAWSSLKSPGVLILHLGDSKDMHLAECANLFIHTYLPRSKYVGVLGVCWEIAVNGMLELSPPRPAWVWRKETEVQYHAPQLDLGAWYPCLDNLVQNIPSPYAGMYLTLSPPMLVKTLDNVAGKKGPLSLTLLDDSVLPGGTKQRGLLRLIDEYNYCDEFVYAGPVSGLAHVGLSYLCQLVNKRATVFLQIPGKDITRWPQYRRTREYGGRVNPVSNTLKATQQQAQEYVENLNDLDSSHPRAYLIPFGMNEQTFIDEYLYQLRLALRDVVPPRRCWLIVGSGTILSCLSQIWPTTIFCTVSVGRKLWLDTYPLSVQERIISYEAPQKFWEAPRDLPPYATIPEYDGKIWQFVLEHGQNGDCIFNVGKS